MKKDKTTIPAPPLDKKIIKFCKKAIKMIENEFGLKIKEDGPESFRARQRLAELREIKADIKKLNK